MDQRWTQIDSKWTNDWTNIDPNWIKSRVNIDQNGLKMAQDWPKWTQNEPMMDQIFTKSWFKIDLRLIKTDSKWIKICPEIGKDRPISSPRLPWMDQNNFNLIWNRPKMTKNGQKWLKHATK